MCYKMPLSFSASPNTREHPLPQNAFQKASFVSALFARHLEASSRATQRLSRRRAPYKVFMFFVRVLLSQI